jgi:hypothetical protein
MLSNDSPVKRPVSDAERLEAPSFACIFGPFTSCISDSSDPTTSAACRPLRSPATQHPPPSGPDSSRATCGEVAQFLSRPLPEGRSADRSDKPSCVCRHLIGIGNSCKEEPFGVCDICLCQDPLIVEFIDESIEYGSFLAESLSPKHPHVAVHLPSLCRLRYVRADN